MSQHKLTIALLLACILGIIVFVLTFLNLSSLAGGKKNVKVPETLKSIYNNPNDYNKAFSKYHNDSKFNVFALTTSHHFLAKDYIAKSFAGVNPNDIETIIIVSPDHFQQIRTPNQAQTTNAHWQTPFGNILSDSNLIKLLQSQNKVVLDTNSFRNEHGIYTLIPFVKKAFPNAKVVPLILKQSNNLNYFYNLGENISKEINIKNTLLVISSDFSHNASTISAKINDEKSIKFLPGKNINEIKNITNDCKQCTAFMFGYLKNSQTDFKLLFNTNSYAISKEGLRDITSYIGAYYLAK